ncbi:hypothetical protein [Streptomyces sp. NPDC005046]
MNDLLTAVALVGLIAVAAYMIHRLNLQHAEGIAEHRYSAARPGRGGHTAPQPPVGPELSDAPTPGERRDPATGAVVVSHRGTTPHRR